MQITFELDQTQAQICRHLAETETLLAKATSRLSSSQKNAQIVPLTDLGLPHNVTRMRGGFYTGAYYSWDCDIPFVPIDATVNGCSVAIFKVSDEIDWGNEFVRRVDNAREEIATNSNLVWNFDTGNHFITLAHADGLGCLVQGSYLVLHSSPAEFKDQFNGLYPVRGNWYYDNIEVVEGANHRYLRYLSGKQAERFYATANMLVNYQKVRQHSFAELIAGPADEVMSVPHYGMPSESSIAIGCQWLNEVNSRYLLLTRPMAPLYLIHALPGGSNQIDVNGQEYYLTPHGLGVESTTPLRIEYANGSLIINGQAYKDGDSIAKERFASIRQLEEGVTLKRVLDAFPGRIADTLVPKYSVYRKVAK